MKEAPWLLLIHQIPPKPDYFRVKVRRRLQKLGAAPLKNSVYALPNNEDSLEDFQWLAQEIRAGGGEAIVMEASSVSGITDEEITRMLVPADVTAAPGRGNVWVTRAGVKVDRISSAWLIRRFIDAEAQFRFVPAKGYQAAPGELRFDMFEGEFTHDGDRCTFEVLRDRFVPGDPALVAIGEIVHELDCKDERYARPEAAGVKAILEGIIASTADDALRIEKGSGLFESIYLSLTARASSR